MNRSVRKMLRLFVPGWVLNDVEHRLTHPYWRRRQVPAPEVARAETVGREGHMEKTSNRRAWRNVDEARVLSKLRAAGAKQVLDVGCGIGNLLCNLESNGFEPWGVTINPQEIAKRVHKNVLLMDIQSDVASSPLAGRTFDAILTFDCLEHLEAPLVALRNINKLLKPGGLLIAYIPPSRWTECDYHIIVYTPRQFRWLLNLTGFDLEACQGRHFFSKRGTTYFARKVHADKMVYPGVLE